MITKFEKLYINDYDPDTMELEYQLTDNCNFHCDYCSFADVNPQPTRQSVDSVLSFVEYLTNIKPYVIFKYFGGEPTIHPDFLYSINRLIEINVDEIMLSTNFSFDYSLLSDNIDLFKHIDICASAHSKYIKHFDEFLIKLKLCSDNQIPITVNVMVDPRHFNTMLRFYEQCKEYACTRLKILTWDVPYTQEQKTVLLSYDDGSTQDQYLVETDFIKTEMLTEHEYKLRDSKFIFNCMYCHAGRRQLYIHCDGNVYFCQKHREDKRVKPIFNIYQDGNKTYDKFNKDVICLFGSCRWGLNMPKYRKKD